MKQDEAGCAHLGVGGEGGGLGLRLGSGGEGLRVLDDVVALDEQGVLHKRVSRVRRPLGSPKARRAGKATRRASFEARREIQIITFEARETGSSPG